MKKLMLAALLFVSMPVFADSAFDKANYKIVSSIWPAVKGACAIGIATCIGQVIVNSFEATRNMDCKDEKILAACVTLYSVFFASSLYEDWLAQQNKDQEEIA
ncbi:hypothetical protein [Candidatus Chromulinivorax destructor]|uniref:Uncharacterized protein n=1 Tax=Candidatus Chromulinivorax destructor TaxID=2066483 RepID=A0A345ZBI5_9BACT|nr:hypothetical protein [Candidatus Chromulinivorax destructor]AXK60652.1 hypothetical protein C0J27_02745 [Candidatus Chromulinivorax destructor]